MHSTYRITGNDLARAFAGIAQSVAKPAKKVRDYSLQAEAFKRAHERLNAHIAFERTRPSKRDWNPTAAERRFMMGRNLKWAYSMIRVENAEIPTERTVSLDECLLIGSDSRFTDRRGL
ncbi:hypothetical protein ACLBWS_05865 [Brucellaceae bacterium D45D]